MKYRNHVFIVVFLTFAGWVISRPLLARPAAKETSSEQALNFLAALQPIDVHVHIFKSDPSFQKFFEATRLTLVNILVMDDTLPYRKELQPQITDALNLAHSSNGHIFLCTTFDPYKFNDASFPSEAIKQIDENFDQGAVAVKIWKNIGMEIKDRNGKFIMPDDPKFTPIYQEIAKRGKTLMSHVAEPDVAWGPADPSDPSWSYYQEHPQWYVAGRTGFPAKKTILEARDHMLASNPKLRMVGVHLGGMEKDLDGIGSRFDQYPNFSIDTGARMEYLMLTPPEKVRAFLIKYQDRVLYGTDLDVEATANAEESLKGWRKTYARDWGFLATDETFDLNGRTVHGLKLPETVLHKIYRTNALHWIPGLH
jgi:predicted TIM-barrel fold metal-dependent hydrolase